MRDVTIKQLRVVAAVAKTGRIINAANELGVTPPAVSLQLKLVEEAAGLPLFERSKGGMRPTDAGCQLLEAAQRVAASMRECGEALKAIRGLGGGCVSVGLVSTAKYFAPRALAAFTKQHPGIELRLLVGNRQQTLEALARLDIDIAITGYPPEALPVDKQIIGDHPHIIIAPPDHRLMARRRIKLRDLGSETFVVREPGSGTRLLMERFFDQAGIRPRIGMEVDSNETIKQAVMAGLGIAFISAHTVAAEVQWRRLGVLNTVGTPVIRKWYAVKHSQKRLLPSAAGMWDFLVSDAGRFLPEVDRMLHKSSRRGSNL